MKIASVVLVVLLAFAFGCGPAFVQGSKFDAGKRDQIVKNQTTSAELESALGKPFKVEKMGGGTEKYIYYYRTEEYVHWYTLDKALFQRLEVSLTGGVVTDYVYTQSATVPTGE
jgi:hypothetical protein